MLADLWVMGEVSNLRVSSSGHSYYTLRDDQAVLNCVMFRGQPGSELLSNGTAVSAHGRITFYEPRGSTDFMVDLAMPQGVGELSLELERLRLRLEAEGLFADSRKRPLPAFPQVVGLVTSPAGAVFHDIEKRNSASLSAGPDCSCLPPRSKGKALLPRLPQPWKAWAATDGPT